MARVRVPVKEGERKERANSKGVLQLRDVGSLGKILSGALERQRQCSQTTFNTEVEEARPGVQQEMSELKFTRPRHVIGSVEITKPMHFETKNNFQELADDEEGNEDSRIFYWESHLEMQQEHEKNNVCRRQNYHREKKCRKMSDDELLEVHSYIQGGTSHDGGKVPSWKQISNVILEEKDPSIRKEMIHWLEGGMKKDSEENLVNNKNDFPELRHAEPNPRKKKKLVLPRTKGSMKKLELIYCGVQQSGDPRRQQNQKEVDDYRRLTSEQNFPEIPTRPSPRSRGGVEYVNANGSTLPNRGEKLVLVKIRGGGHCALKLQVTDAQRTLLSVSKVCDGGHEVVFRSDGGFIRHVETNRKIGKFQRVNGVYRMEVEVEEDATAGFSWAE